MPTACKKIHELLSTERIVELETRDKTEALRILSAALSRDGRVRDGAALFEAILRREAIASTDIGHGIAAPHVKIPEVTDYVAALGRSRTGIDFGGAEPARLIVMIAASDRQTREFVHLLAALTHLVKAGEVRNALLEAPGAEAILAFLDEYER